MKIKIMTTEALNYIKSNINAVIDHYFNHETPEIWVRERISKPAFIEVDSIVFPDFSLKIDETKPFSTDIENIKLLYISMKELNDSFATDERLWAGLSHTIFYDYVLKRFPLDLDNRDKASKDVINHFFFGTTKPRCYLINTLSRLWWLGKKTFYEEESNPFKILDYIAHDINGYAFTLFGSNWSNNVNTLKMFFEGVFEFEKDSGEKVGRNLINNAMQYINCLCGIYILDACDNDFIKEKTYEYLFKRSDDIKKEEDRNKKLNIRKTGIGRLDTLILSLNSIGGHGSLNDIYNAFSAINNGISNSDKTYINENLKAYSPDSKGFDKKAYFFKSNFENQNMWRLGIDYLTTPNLLKRKSIVTKQINGFDDSVKLVFNIISAIRNDRFTYDEILQFKQTINQYDNRLNAEEIIRDALMLFRRKGVLEYQGNSLFRKSYNMVVDYENILVDEKELENINIDADNFIFYSKMKHGKAIMVIKEGKFILKEGSVINISDRISPSLIALQKECIENKIILLADGLYRVTKDLKFNSIDSLSAFVSGYNVDGFTFWNDEKDKKLGDYIKNHN